MKKAIAIVSLFFLTVFGFAFALTGVVYSETAKQALVAPPSHAAATQQPQLSFKPGGIVQNQMKTFTIAQQSGQVTQPNKSPVQFNT